MSFGPNDGAAKENTKLEKKNIGIAQKWPNLSYDSLTSVYQNRGTIYSFLKAYFQGVKSVCRLRCRRDFLRDDFFS